MADKKEMRNIEILLDDAERDYRRNAFRTYVLRSDIEIIRRKDRDSRSQYWSWSTDLKKTYVQILEPEKLMRFLQTEVQEHWKEDPEKLAIDLQQCLLWHESYHPKEAPYSDFPLKEDDPNAKRSDATKIRQAIWRGMKEADPNNAKGSMQIAKVAVAENLVEDLILDNALYLGNQDYGYYRKDVRPVFDFIELLEHNEKEDTQYTISRYIYGSLFGPETLPKYFEEKVGPMGISVSEDVLSAILKRKVELPKTGKAVSRETLDQICQEMRGVFNNEETRYEAVKDMMKVLGKYKFSNPKNGGMSNMSQGGVAGMAGDLMDGMSEEEKKEFLEELANSSDEDKDKAAKLMDGPSFGAGKDLPKQIQQIDLYATHEQYKMRKPTTIIMGSGLEGVEQGKIVQQYFHPVRTEVMTPAQYHARYNDQRIHQASIRTGKPWKINLKSGLVRIIEYEQRERKIIIPGFVDKAMDVPDHVEFYLDTSGSMHANDRSKLKKGQTFTVGDNSRQDMLYHVTYGFADALDKGGKVVRKSPKMRINNFADRTVSSPVISVSEFLRGNTDVLKVLYQADNGSGTTLNIDDKIRFPGKTTYVIATDGATYNYEEEARKMMNLAKMNNVVLFEIGGTFELGRMISRAKGCGVQYFQVHDAKKMMEEGIKVLLSR